MTSSHAQAPQDAAPAQRLAEFVAALRYEAIPEAVRERAKLLILDAVGVGLAANAYPFAARTLAGLQALGGGGSCTVIGRPERLAVRDAALANGILIHGLDFDDSNLVAILHPTAACLPCALSFGEELEVDGRALLTAYVAGMEAAIRIGASVKGGFHHVGFHATGVVAHFSSALVAGKLLGLDPARLVSAQGIAASTASAVQVFLEEGAWTKRFHPGWAAVAGITAARLAEHGFFGPSRPYDGKFGLYETHLQAHAAEADAARISAALGERWELTETAIKPYPVCHFIHGCAEAAILLANEIGSADEIAEVQAFLPKDTLPIVAEPAAAKERPANEYDAKFSAQFVVATCLIKGRFGLAELRDEALADPEILRLAARVRCAADPETGFPKYCSGGLVVKLRGGRELKRHIFANLGAGERALGEAEISAKFRASAGLTVSPGRAEQIRDAVLGLDQLTAPTLARALRG